MKPQHPSNPVDVKVDNSIAALWSMMLPGLGQLMKGQIMPGLFWAVFTGFGYFCFFWPGLVLHGICIIDAAFNKGENSWIGLKTFPQKIAFFSLIALLIAYIIVRNF